MQRAAALLRAPCAAVGMCVLGLPTQCAAADGVSIFMLGPKIDYKNWEVLWMYLIVFGVTIMFEISVGKLHTKYASDSGRAIVNHVTKEVMILGGISAVLVMFENLGGGDLIDATLFHYVHFVIFLMMIIFIVQVALLFLTVDRAWRTWTSFENRIFEYENDPSLDFNAKTAFMKQYAEGVPGGMRMLATFIFYRANIPQQVKHVPFSRYMKKRQRRIMIQLLDLHHTSWAFLGVLVFVQALAAHGVTEGGANENPLSIVALWSLLIGFLPMFVAVVVAMKVRYSYKEFTTHVLIEKLRLIGRTGGRENGTRDLPGSTLFAPLAARSSEDGGVLGADENRANDTFDLLTVAAEPEPVVGKDGSIRPFRGQHRYFWRGSPQFLLSILQVLLLCQVFYTSSLIANFTYRIIDAEPTWGWAVCLVAFLPMQVVFFVLVPRFMPQLSVMASLGEYADHETLIGVLARDRKYGRHRRGRRRDEACVTVAPYLRRRDGVFDSLETITRFPHIHPPQRGRTETCGECGDAAATVVCYKCGYLCDRCSSLYHRLKRNAQHRRTRLTAAPPAEGAAAAAAELDEAASIIQRTMSWTRKKPWGGGRLGLSAGAMNPGSPPPDVSAASMQRASPRGPRVGAFARPSHPPIEAADAASVEVGARRDQGREHGDSLGRERHHVSKAVTFGSPQLPTTLRQSRSLGSLPPPAVHTGPPVPLPAGRATFNQNPVAVSGQFLEQKPAPPAGRGMSLAARCVLEQELAEDPLMGIEHVSSIGSDHSRLLGARRNSSDMQRRRASVSVPPRPPLTSLGTAPHVAPPPSLDSLTMALVAAIEKPSAAGARRQLVATQQTNSSQQIPSSQSLI